MAEQQTVNLQRANLGIVGCLAALAVIAVAGFWNLSGLLKKQAGAAPTINVSGRQRMLSQRVSSMTLQLAGARDTGERRDAGRKLAAAVGLMRESHDALINGDAARGISPAEGVELERMYGGDQGLDAEVSAFLESAERVLESGEDEAQTRAELEHVLRQANGPLLDHLSKTVGIYEAESASLGGTVVRGQLILLALTLVVLAAV